MAVEAYNVSYDKINYHAKVGDNQGIEVFSAREQEITDNLVRYLGEYRLGVKFDEYYYRTETDEQTGEKYFVSYERGPIRDVYRKAIFAREAEGLSSRREVAECLGFEKLEKSLIDAPTGTMALWVSPPGKNEDGYGGYSFTFLSQVVEEEGEKRVRMIPYRNEKSIEEHNSYLSKLTGEKVELTNDSQFLSTPFVISAHRTLQTPEDILQVIGENEKFDAEWSEKLIKKAWPLLQGYLYLVKNNASDEALIKARNALENFAIAFKKGVDTDFNIPMDASFETSVSWAIDAWGAITPPVVRGSCGVAGENEKIITPMEFQSTYGTLIKDKYGERTFECPACKKENIRPFNTLLSRCQHCKSTKVAC